MVGRSPLAGRHADRLELQRETGAVLLALGFYAPEARSTAAA